MRNAPDEARDIAQLVVDTYRNEDVKKMFLHVVGLLWVLSFLALRTDITMRDSKLFPSNEEADVTFLSLH